MNASLHNVPARPVASDAERSPAAVQHAFAALMHALGITEACDAQTPARAAALWVEHLLVGQGADLRQALGPTMPTTLKAPVIIEPIGFHLVCPHHLTVASGEASIAYLPQGHIVGFGRLAHLVALGTARPALQEDAAADIADALMHSLGARAVAVRLRAEHLCHTVLHPRSHGARATTWGLLGDAAGQAQLQACLSP